MDGIFARESSYLSSYVQVGVASDRVISVSFPKHPDDDAVEDHDLLERLFAYLEGVEDDFQDVEIGLTVDTDARALLQATREIPYGEQRSTEDVALLAGLDPDDESVIDDARNALAQNPVPIFVPDHRVRDGPSAAPPEIEQKLRSLEGL